MGRKPSYAQLQAELDSVQRERDRFAVVVTDALHRAAKSDIVGAESVSWIEIEGGDHVMRLYRPLNAPGGVVVASFHPWASGSYGQRLWLKPVVSTYLLDDYYTALKEGTSSGSNDAQALFEQVAKLVQVRNAMIAEEIEVAVEARKGRTGAGRG